jgi:hypothetical protein
MVHSAHAANRHHVHTITWCGRAGTLHTLEGAHATLKPFPNQEQSKSKALPVSTAVAAFEREQVTRPEAHNLSEVGGGAHQSK